MLHTTPMALGGVRGTIYDFDAVGDELPMHEHGPRDVHISIVARGSFELHGDGWSRTVTSGDVIDFQPGQRHGFIATSDKSRLVNIVK